MVYQKPEYKWIIEKDKFLDTMDQELDFENDNTEGDQEEQTLEGDSDQHRKTSIDIKNSISFDSIYRTLEP